MAIDNREKTLVEKALEEWIGVKRIDVRHSFDKMDEYNRDAFKYVHYIYSDNQGTEIIFDTLSESVFLHLNSDTRCFSLEVLCLLIERAKELGFEQVNWNNETGRFDRTRVNKEVCCDEKETP